MIENLKQKLQSLKQKLKQKKKGNVLLLSLMTMIMLFVLSAVFINIFMTYETMNRILTSSEEIARARAQAIDVPVKEYTGHVEVIHPVHLMDKDGKLYDYPEEDVDFHDKIDQDMQKNLLSGHAFPWNPYGSNLSGVRDSQMKENYADYVKLADDAAKLAGLTYLENSLGATVDGDMLAEIDEGNICFDIRPLPETSTLVTFRCMTDLGLVEHTEFVDGKALHTYTIENESGTNRGKYQEVEVKNVVFVGMKFQYKHFLYKGIESLGWFDPPVRTVTSIAYPQLDVCYGAHCN